MTLKTNLKTKGLKPGWAFLFTCTLVFSSFVVFPQTIQDALYAIRNEQPEKAKGILLKMLSANPADAEANYRLGNLYYSLGKRDSASYYFQKGTKPEDKINYNFAGHGKLALDDKNEIKAQEYFNKLISNGKSRDAKAYTFVADAYFNSKLKDVKRALEMAEKATGLDIKNVEAQLLKADIYQAVPDAGKAVTSYEYAIEGDPKLAFAHMKIGQIYMNAKNYELAHQHFLKGNQADPEFIPMYRELAEFNFYAKNYREAVNLQKQYMEKAGETVDNMTKYAKYLFMNKDYENTVKVIKTIMQQDSSDVIMSRLIGYSAFEEGKYEEGLDFMENFFDKADTSKVISSDYAYYGKLLAKNGKDSLAIVFLVRAIALEPENADLYNDLAIAFYSQKKYVESAAVMEKMLTLKSGTSQDYFQLGKAYYYGQDFANADTAFTKVTEMQPAIPVGYLWRARCNSQLDPESEKGLALPHYQKFVELATDATKYKDDLVQAYSYFGYYYAVIREDMKEGEKAWKKVKELDPQNEKAKEFYKYLDSLKNPPPKN
jgi:tetratricopeptide (TPR) repeat protein